jgi:hypothetical protein
MITLEPLAPWLYPFFLMAGFASIGCLSMIARRVIGPCQSNRKTRTPYVLIAVTSSITTYYCFESMFLRFHGLEIGPAQVELVYVWPRPRVRIRPELFERVEVSRDRKGNSDVNVITKEGSFRSVPFSRTVKAEEIQSSLEKWVVAQRN